MGGAGPSFSDEEFKTNSRMYPQTKWQQRLNAFQSYWENQKLQIFWVFLYTMVCIGIFAERAYCKYQVLS